MTILLLIIAAVVVFFCWNWVEERGTDLLAFCGKIFRIGIIAGATWLFHAICYDGNDIFGWIVSGVVVFLCGLAWYKHNG